MDKEYGRLSSLYYHYSKPVGFSLDNDIEYYKGKLKDVDGYILEAGVGTGRVLIPLLEEGFKVDGVDNSQHMIKLCEENLKAFNLSANLYTQDLLDLNIDKKYQAIIMPTGSFCIIQKAHALEVLNNFYNHLEEDGELIVDIGMPSDFIPFNTYKNTVDISKSQSIYLVSKSQRMDWINQRTSSVNTYQLLEDGELIKEDVAEFILYWYGIEEFLRLLNDANFRDISYEVGYGTERDDIVTFIAKR